MPRGDKILLVDSATSLTYGMVVDALYRVVWSEVGEIWECPDALLGSTVSREGYPFIHNALPIGCNSPLFFTSLSKSFCNINLVFLPTYILNSLPLFLSQLSHSLLSSLSLVLDTFLWFSLTTRTLNNTLSRIIQSWTNQILL